jgi:hypothetical protein
MTDAKTDNAEFLADLRKQVDELLGTGTPAAAADAAPAADATPAADAAPATPAADAAPAVDADFSAKLDALGKNVAALTGDDSPILKALAAHSEALVKALDRIEALEKGTAVKKSLDPDLDGGEEGTPEEKGMRSLSKAFAAVATTGRPLRIQ